VPRAAPTGRILLVSEGIQASPPAAPRSRGRPAVAAVQIVVSLVALGAVVWWALQQQAPTFPDSPRAIAALTLSLLLYALVTLVRAERWHRILRRTDVKTGRGDSFRLTTVGYMGNNVLPARGGDVLRAFLLAPRTGARKRAVLGTVVAERLLDALALGCLFGLVVFGLLRDGDVPGRRIWLFGSGGALVAAALGLSAAVLIRRAGLLERVRAHLRPFAAPTRALASGHGLGLLLVSALIWTLESAVYLAVAEAAGLDLTLLDALYVVALTNLVALVPAAPGYVGTFDAAVLFAVGLIGEGGSQSLSYLVLLRFVLFVPITLVGFAFLVTRYGGWSRLKAARIGASPG
jgi:uncharacterized membrane protein YbhN (UPF0104 family)